MTIVKSFSVGDGDMFYIKHGSDNFTIIDCCLTDERKESIVDEIINESTGKDILRFISTHPDEDHLQGLEYLDDQIGLLNFYCVQNETTKAEETPAFIRYRELRNSEKAYHIYKGCRRRWMNVYDDERGSAGIEVLWPITWNTFFQEELKKAKNGESPNNISPIIQYTLTDGISALWMGDLETDFMDNIKNDLDLSHVAILFAPHHGRESGKIPNELLNTLTPDVVIIGEAPSNNLNYYQNYNTITQNSAGDIVFVCDVNKVHICVSNENYFVNFLSFDYMANYYGYIGTLYL
jgi:beta-lactamase superfamily II metal-dependent hydrolase